MRRRERIKKNFRQARKCRSVPGQLVDLVRQRLKGSGHWEDYYLFEFYKGEKTWDERDLYVGYYGSKYWPWEGNSLKFDRLFLLKSLQKSILIASGLATPPMLMKVGLDYSINNADKFRDAMARIRKPVMTKFDGGGSGLGIYLLEPVDGKFRCGDRIVDSDWIWDQYKSSIHRGFLVEEQMENHATLGEVNPASLNTLRLTTVKTVDGRWHFLLPYIKFGRHGVQVDNMDAGGLFASVDANGCAGTAFRKKKGGEFDEHPDSGKAIKGLIVPFFEEAKSLALEASKTFGFMSTIAWDVGITPDGPSIIEGNPNWDPQGFQEKLGPFLTPEVVAGLRPRSWWTPWDKTHMYPDYMKDAHGGWWQKRLARRRQK